MWHLAKKKKKIITHVLKTFWKKYHLAWFPEVVIMKLAYKLTHKDEWVC